MDQAKTLRRLLGQRKTAVHSVFCDVANGHGAELASLFLEGAAAGGTNTVLIDGERNGVSKLRALRVKYEMDHVLSGAVSLEDVCLPTGPFQWVIPAYRGIKTMQVQLRLAHQFLQSLHRLPVTPDLLAACVTADSLQVAVELCAHAGYWYWVVEPTSQSVTTVYAGLKEISAQYPDITHYLLVVEAADCHEADHVFSNLTDVSRKFLETPLEYAGFLPSKKSVDFHEASRRVMSSMMSHLNSTALA